MKKSLTLSLLLIFCLTICAQDESSAKEPIVYIFDSTKSVNLEAHIFYPADKDLKEQNSAIVIFHGGGWSTGEPSWGFKTAERYAAKGMVAIAAQYRLSDQEDITPTDAMEDARNIILWLRMNSEQLQIDKDKIVAYGWSAGAHLASCAAVFYSTDSSETVTSVPNALVLKSPALSLKNDGWFKKLLGDGRTVGEYSPAEHIKEDMPPSIILVGKYDTVTPARQSKLFHENMLKFGNESYLHIYDGVGHLFTPKDQPDDGFPHADKKTQAKANNEVDLFLKRLGYIE